KIAAGDTLAGILGSAGVRPSDCASDGATGCVAISNFPAVDKVNKITANAGKIRSSVSIVGVTGTLADCASDGGEGCVSTAAYPSALASGAAAKILTGQTLGGIAGSAAVSPSNCTSDGATNCIAVTNFPAVDKVNNITANAAKIRSSVTIAGVIGSLADCTTDGGQGCVSSAAYPAALATGAAAKILTGQTVAGVNGSAAVKPANCGSDGETNCVAVTNFPAVDKVANVTSNANKIRVGVTIAGINGSLADCNSDGGQGCVSGATYPAALVTGAAAKILSGQTLAGVSGSAGIRPSDCAGENATNCVAIANFPAISGISGEYPSSNFPLSVSDGYTDIDSSTFNAKIKASANFGWFDRNGTRYSAAGDTDISGTNIRTGIDIFGTSGSFGTDCTADGQTSCVTTSTFKSVNTSALNSWDIRTGKSAGGIAGAITFFKNQAKISFFDRQTGTGAVTGVDYYDTVEDLNSGSDLPAGFVANTGQAWARDPSSDTGGGALTNNGICDAGEDCVYKDRVSGMYWAKGDKVGYTWETAITYCDGLVLGSYSDWRVPTQKEYMQAYIDGLYYMRTPLNFNNALHITSTTRGSSATFWPFHTAEGYAPYANKTDTMNVLCTR
ncbi:MAG: DUF1566 domain-containing protein, partial [Proteobacteria bacterium]